MVGDKEQLDENKGWILCKLNYKQNPCEINIVFIVIFLFVPGLFFIAWRGHLFIISLHKKMIKIKN